MHVIFVFVILIKDESLLTCASMFHIPEHNFPSAWAQWVPVSCPEKPHWARDRNWCHAPWRCPVWTGAGVTWQYVTTSVRSVVSQSAVSLQRVCPVQSGPDLRWPPIHYEYWESGDTNIKSHSSTRGAPPLHITCYMCVLCVYCVTCPRNRSGSLTIIQYQSPNNLINQLPIITSKWPKLGRLSIVEKINEKVTVDSL